MKTQTIPYVLPELRVELCSQGVKFDTCTAFGVNVNLRVRQEPVSEKHDTPHVVVEAVMLAGDRAMFAEGDFVLDVRTGTNVFHLIPRSEIEAIEENLLTQLAGNN